jgi:hypothetical protein
VDFWVAVVPPTFPAKTASSRRGTTPRASVCAGTTYHVGGEWAWEELNLRPHAYQACSAKPVCAQLEGKHALPTYTIGGGGAQNAPENERIFVPPAFPARTSLFSPNRVGRKVRALRARSARLGAPERPHGPPTASRAEPFDALAPDDPPPLPTAPPDRMPWVRAADVAVVMLIVVLLVALEAIATGYLHGWRP